MSVKWRTVRTVSEEVICAIDGSLTSSGVTIGNWHDVTYMEKFGTTAGTPMARRLWEIYCHFRDLFTKHQVTRVVLESKFVNPKKDMNSALDLGRVDGAIMIAAEDLGIPCEYLAPSAIKKKSTGKGNAKKEDVIQAMKARFKDHPVVTAAAPEMVRSLKSGRMVKNKIDDLYDSLAIWYTYTELQSNP